MKNRLLLYTLLALGLGNSSCEKFLTNDSPSGITDAQWWKTEADAINALGTVYVGTPGGSRGRNIMYYSGLSDEAVHRGDWKGEYDSFTRGLASSRWGISNMVWEDDYIAIRRANRFLENVDKAFFDAALKERMKFEARALRAYYHMEMLMLFGDIPLLTKSLTPNENQSKRTPKAEVYKFVVDELKACAEELPSTYVDRDRFRITSGVCWALISRLALYEKDYDLAVSASKKIIDSKVYRLWTSKTNKSKSFNELFSYVGQLNNERIFTKQSGCSNTWTSFAPFGVGGETYLSPTNTVVDNFETKQGKTIQELGQDSLKIYQKNPNHNNNRDPRMTASVFIPNEIFPGNYKLDPFNNPSDKIGETKSTATGFWIKKYVDARDRQAKNGSLDFMIIRYAEILLNYAEAKIELNQWNEPEVIQYINEIRDRAGMPALNTTIYNSQAKMREFIRRERQAELALEGGRYFDLRRWGIATEKMNGMVYGATNPQTGELVQVQARTYRENRELLWPIPEQEMIANPNMVQNPNY